MAIDLDKIRNVLEARSLGGGRWSFTSGGTLWDGYIIVRAATREMATEKLANAIADAAAKGVPAWQLPDEL